MIFLDLHLRQFHISELSDLSGPALLFDELQASVLNVIVYYVCRILPADFFLQSHIYFWKNGGMI